MKKAKISFGKGIKFKEIKDKKEFWDMAESLLNPLDQKEISKEKTLISNSSNYGWSTGQNSLSGYNIAVSGYINYGTKRYP